MLKFENADFLKKRLILVLGAGFMLKNRIEHENFVNAIPWEHMSLHGLFDELKNDIDVALSSGLSAQMKVAYLQRLQADFSDEIISIALSQTAELRTALLEEELNSSTRIPSAPNVSAWASVKMQALYSFGNYDFSPEQRRVFGQYYLIATTGDTIWNGVLHEIERQLALWNIAVEPAATDIHIAAPPPLLIQKVRFCNGFSVEDADHVALEIELIDIEGNYTGLPGKALGRLCGFYKELRTQKKVAGSLENLRDYFAERYLKRHVSSKPAPESYIAQDTARETKTALERLFIKKNLGEIRD